MLLEGTQLTPGLGNKKRAEKGQTSFQIIMSNAYTNTILLDLCSLISQVSVASLATVIKKVMQIR